MATSSRKALVAALLPLLMAAAGCGSSEELRDAATDKGTAMDSKPADGAGGSGGGGGGGGSQPAIIITAPADNSTVTAVNLNVVYTVLNFTLKAQGTCAGATTCGHVAVLVDGAACNDTAGGKPYNGAGIASPIEVRFGLCPMAAGTHTIALELHRDDGTAVRNAAGAIISDRVTVIVSTTTPVDAGDAPRDTMPPVDAPRDMAADMRPDAGTDAADAARDADAAPTDVPVEAPPSDAVDSPVEAAPDTGGSGGSGGTNDAGSDGSGGSDGGGSDTTDGGTLAFTAVAPCNTEGDYTIGTGTNTIAFDSTPVYMPRCLKVPRGATVTFQGPFGTHALAPSTLRGTTLGNPITAAAAGTSKDITFTSSGFFAFYCSLHGADNGAGMSGVVWVP